ncbi:hypothetical protein ECZC04_53080 [Escherichia coli]|nr:hypothetical protein ECZC04_53080 [Escherichia coli]
MASIHSLLSACQTTPRDVAEPAQARIALWDKWLAPVTPDNPAGDDAGTMMIFSRCVKRSINSPEPMPELSASLQKNY